MIKNKLLYIITYLFWALSRMIVYIFIRKKLNIIMDPSSDAIPKPPFVMVSNHGTFFDPWIVGHFSKYPLAIMMNEDAYYAPPITRWYLKNIGTFPKKKGSSDYRAMKLTLKKLKQGHPVLIFPEGQTSWDGKTQPIFTGIEKIIKHAKVNLVMMNVKGNFLSKPWWADTYRKGCVRVTSKTLHRDHLNLQSEKQVLETIIKFIHNNDILDTENGETTFTGSNLAQGLERFLWLCKNCRSSDCLETKNNTVICSHCNASWEMDSHCQFKKNSDHIEPIKNLYEWTLWHKKVLKQHIHDSCEKTVLTKNDDVHYGFLDQNGKFVTLAQGTLSLTKSLLSFQTKTDQSLSCSIETKDISNYVFQRTDIFECQSRHNKTYRFRFHHKSPMKWVYFFRYLNKYEIFEERGYI